MKERLPAAMVNVENWANKGWRWMGSLAECNEVESIFFFSVIKRSDA